MKFDLIIMNPPYQKNLHLKILDEAINHMKNEDSVCVNLSPVRWLQDPIAQYKKLSDYKRFEENVSKHIETLNVFSMKDVNNFFDIAIFSDIGIYKIRNYQIKGFDYKEFNESKFANCKTIREKIFSYMLSDETHSCNYHLTTDENNDDYRVIITLIVGHPGEQHLKHFYEFPCRKEIYKNGLDISSSSNKKSESRQSNKPVSSRTTINFKTENEAKNFISYSKLNIMTFCGIISKSDMHPQFKFFPFLGNEINPRTGLRGYESEWTDEDLYTFFEITPEEQKIIEETISQYR